MAKQIYLKISGACGNQFFQYAFARMLQEKHGGELVIDYQDVIEASNLWAGSVNLLQDFNTVPYRYVEKWDNPKKSWIRLINKIRRTFDLKDFDKRTYKFMLFIAKHFERFGLYYFDAAYFPYKYPDSKNILIQGYFEAPKYFAEIDDKIRAELTPKQPLLPQNKELFEAITTKESVCISIKRQDVENPDIPDAYNYDINYFYNAVSYIKERHPDAVWIIFSDNVEWCKENFHIDGEVHYETEGNPIWEKIRLMSSCKHFIIHNSTFSWWVQHLSANKDKMVILPTKWLQRDDQPIDIYEDHFIYMTNNGEVHATHD